jgi:hypothetical protein
MAYVDKEVNRAKVKVTGILIVTMVSTHYFQNYLLSSLCVLHFNWSSLVDDFQVKRQRDNNLEYKNGFHLFSWQQLVTKSSYFTYWLIITSRWPLLILMSLFQRSTSHRGLICRMISGNYLKNYIWQSLHISHIRRWLDFRITRSKVNITVNSNIKLVSG